MRNCQRNDNSDSVLDTIIIVIKLILSAGLLIGIIGFVIYLFIAPFLNHTFQESALMIVVLIFFWICNIIGEGILSLFD